MREEVITVEVDELYLTPVDYSVTFNEMVAAGRYNSFCFNITEEHFPLTDEERKLGKVEAWIQVGLAHFDREVTTREVITELDQAGYRPATAWELFAFGARYPEVQKRFPIVALGSFWQEPSGDPVRCYSVCLHYWDGRRGLRLDGFHYIKWHPLFRFATVRKGV